MSRTVLYQTASFAFSGTTLSYAATGNFDPPHCRKRAAEQPVQSEDDIKRQRLAKLAAWRQQQTAEPVKAEQPSSPQAFAVFEQPFEEEDAPKAEPQQTAWYALWLPHAVDPQLLVSSCMLHQYGP